MKEGKVMEKEQQSDIDTEYQRPSVQRKTSKKANGIIHKFIYYWRGCIN